MQLACLSHVLRQLIVFHSDLHRFVTDLKQRLGPQLQNVPLLYEGAPELKTIFSLFDLTIDTPQEVLETNELPARFQSLVENVFSVLSEIRLFALFLDDLHEAPDSLVSALDLRCCILTLLVQLPRPHQCISELADTSCTPPLLTSKLTLTLTSL